MCVERLFAVFYLSVVSVAKSAVLGGGGVGGRWGVAAENPEAHHHHSTASQFFWLSCVSPAVYYMCVSPVVYYMCVSIYIYMGFGDDYGTDIHIQLIINMFMVSLIPANCFKRRKIFHYDRHTGMRLGVMEEGVLASVDERLIG